MDVETTLFASWNSKLLQILDEVQSDINTYLFEIYMLFNEAKVKFLEEAAYKLITNLNHFCVVSNIFRVNCC